MLSRRAMRRMASPNRLGHGDHLDLRPDSSVGWVSTLSVMKSRSIGLASSRSLAVAGEHAVADRRVHRGGAALEQHPRPRR